MADTQPEREENYVLSLYQPLNKSLGGKTNRICTSKYTFVNFLVLNIWEQFHSLANVYFLVLMCFQAIPEISITYGKPTLILPLSLVLAVGAVKDALEDLKKHQADKAENERLVHRLDPVDDDTSAFLLSEPGRWPRDAWQTVRPGDLLLLKSGERVPADMLLLHSNEPSRSCHVETMNLDGETNLKLKACALPEGVTWNTLKGFSLSFEPPSSELYEFRGALSKGDETIGISISNLLLRGSNMATDEVLGMVVYTGHDSRIMRNAKAARLKRSHLDMYMNSVMLYIFAFELLCCILAGLLYVIWEVSYGEDHWYLQLGGEDSRAPAYAWSVKTGTWILQMSNMVPISLMVSITVVKFAQGAFVTWDISMRDKLRNQSAAVQCSQVLESLGQVTHVFSDKTGTLTCNEMRYKACSVNKDIYGMHAQESFSSSAHVDFNDSERLLERLGELQDDSEIMTVTNFLICHAVCHTVAILNDSKRNDAGWRPVYGADSPDELALVSAAQLLGLTFEDMKGSLAMCQSGSGTVTMVLRVASDKRLHNALKKVTGWNPSTSLEVTICNICEFDNVRKRMSVIARYPNGKLLLLMKGADSSILKEEMVDLETPVIQYAQKHLLRFARRGLRTLCLACRELEEHEYDFWRIDFKKASEDMTDERGELVSTQVERIESQAKGFRFLGASAIEDRLQDSVPQVISDLRKADIAVWVLTGDKMETAIAIGKSCNLLTSEMHNFELNVISEAESHLDQINEQLQSDDRSPDMDSALTISGSVLGRVLEDETLAQKFFEAARRCRSVLCCRVSPKQKAQVVENAIRYYQSEDPVTLAIGDGANDVAMITTAHVGIGLSGKEGAQAARAADFAFAEFRFLRRLLFVHGIESYRRNAVLICYNFYKNMILVMAPFFYGQYMSYSGQPYYDQILYQFFNVVFTCTPVMLYALFDRPKSEELNEKAGYVEFTAYKRGRAKEYFNRRVFLVWMITAIIQAFFLTNVAFWALGDGTICQGITSGDLWSVGTVIFMWVVLAVSVTLWNRMTLSFWFSLLAIVLSCLLHPAAVFAMSDILDTYFLRGVFSFMYGRGFGRFAVATVLAMGIHVAVGEPLMALAQRTQRQLPPVQYDKVAASEITHDSTRQSRDSAESYAAVTSPGSHRDSTPNSRGSVVCKEVDAYSNSMLNKECVLERRASLIDGRRRSMESLGSVYP